MISPLPLFYVNLYQRGPHLGIIGAKVRNILPSVLHSHSSRNVEAWLSLVERFIGMLHQLSYAIKNQHRARNTPQTREGLGSNLDIEVENSVFDSCEFWPPIWGIWFSVNSWSDGSDLASDLPDCGEGLGGLVHLPGQAAQGEDLGPNVGLAPCTESVVTFQINKSVMKYVVGGVWLGTFTLGFLPLCGWNRYVYEVTSQSGEVLQ